MSLYDKIKESSFEGLSMELVRKYAVQILDSLAMLKEHFIIHCDLKPENILIKDKEKDSIKLIDFGSSCFESEKIYLYIQSRFYRAPEVLLEVPYTSAIDMWSFACILCELFTGFPIFPGENANEQLALIMEVNGIPPREFVRVRMREKRRGGRGASATSIRADSR